MQRGFHEKRENLVFGDSIFTNVDTSISDNNEYNNVNSGTWVKESAQRKESEPSSLLGLQCYAAIDYFHQWGIACP